MSRYASRVGVAVALILSLAVDARISAQQARGGRGAQAASPADPFIGTWRLDRGKSTFTGVIPEWRTHSFEKVATGIKHTTRSMVGEVTQTLTYTFQFDGKDYPADVQMAVNTVSFKQVDARTLERTGKYQGELYETVIYELSADGKTLTIKQSIVATGTENVQVYNKEP